MINDGQHPELRLRGAIVLNGMRQTLLLATDEPQPRVSYCTSHVGPGHCFEGTVGRVSVATCTRCGACRSCTPNKPGGHRGSN